MEIEGILKKIYLHFGSFHRRIAPQEEVQLISIDKAKSREIECILFGFMK